MKYKIRIEGTRPIIIQSDRLADPLNEVTKQLKLLTSHKDKTTDIGQAKIAEVEWFGGLYCDDEGKPSIAIPGDNLLRAIRDAAAFSKKGETVRREIIIDEALIPFEYEGPKSVDAMSKDPRFTLRKTVVLQKRRTVRTRPRLPPPWSLTFHARIDGAKTLTKDDLKLFLERAGTVGIGTWRPRYGHFRVAQFDAVKD